MHLHIYRYLYLYDQAPNSRRITLEIFGVLLVRCFRFVQGLPLLLVASTNLRTVSGHGQGAGKELNREYPQTEDLDLT